MICLTRTKPEVGKGMLPCICGLLGLDWSKDDAHQLVGIKVFFTNAKEILKATSGSYNEVAGGKYWWEIVAALDYPPSDQSRPVLSDNGRSLGGVCARPRMMAFLILSRLVLSDVVSI